MIDFLCADHMRSVRLCSASSPGFLPSARYLHAANILLTRGRKLLHRLQKLQSPKPTAGTLYHSSVHHLSFICVCFGWSHVRFNLSSGSSQRYQDGWQNLQVLNLHFKHSGRGKRWRGDGDEALKDQSWALNVLLTTNHLKSLTADEAEVFHRWAAKTFLINLKLFNHFNWKRTWTFSELFDMTSWKVWTLKEANY